MIEDNNDVSDFKQVTYDTRITPIETQINSMKALLPTQINENAETL